jgi:hypothetical protein
MARKKSDMINEVLAQFDFDKVHKVMTYLNWKWFDKASVPLISDLKESAEQRLDSAIEQALDPKNKEHHDIGWISYSGGFKATAWRTKKNKLARIQLEFIVDDWDVDNSEVAK